jgi:hypothetical protein
MKGSEKRVPNTDGVHDLEESRNNTYMSLCSAKRLESSGMWCVDETSIDLLKRSMISSITTQRDGHQYLQYFFEDGIRSNIVNIPMDLRRLRVRVEEIKSL